MAVYGPEGAATGNIAFTGFSPTLGGDTGASDAQVPATSGNVKQTGLTQADHFLSKLTRRYRVFRGLMQGLIGATSGSNVTVTHSRETATQALSSITTYGGLLPIETVTDINRNTTATDVSNLKAAIDRQTKPASYIEDAGGNGGGGKSGF